MIEYMTVVDASSLWKVSAEQVEAACKDGKVPDAALLGGQWIIPNNAASPFQPRLEKTDAEIIGKTHLQEAVIRIIQNGDNLGAVTTGKVGNTTYVVSGIFQRQGRTAEERIYHLLKRETSIPLDEYNKTLSDVRKRSRIFKTTFEQRKTAMRRLLELCGFEAETVDELLQKWESDYEAPDMNNRTSKK